MKQEIFLQMIEKLKNPNYQNYLYQFDASASTEIPLKKWLEYKCSETFHHQFFGKTDDLDVSPAAIVTYADYFTPIVPPIHAKDTVSPRS